MWGNLPANVTKLVMWNLLLRAVQQTSISDLTSWPGLYWSCSSWSWDMVAEVGSPDLTVEVEIWAQQCDYRVISFTTFKPSFFKLWSQTEACQIRWPACSTTRHWPVGIDWSPAPACCYRIEWQVLGKPKPA